MKISLPFALVAIVLIGFLFWIATAGLAIGEVIKPLPELINVLRGG